MSNEPRCPKCHGFDLQKMEDHPPLYRCRKCNMLTDCQDDGDIGKRNNPERHAISKEEFHNRQRAREAARRNRQHGNGAWRHRW
jgi:hypothetical protein